MLNHRVISPEQYSNFHTVFKDVKVEKISDDSLDSIPSPPPSVKIQIVGGKFTWDNKAKHCWVMSKVC